MPKKTKKRTTKRAAPEPVAELLPPAEPTLQPQAPEPEPVKATGIMGLFTSPAVAESSTPSATPSASSSISAEQVAELASVPDTIGGEAAAPGAPATPGAGELDEMVEFLQSMGIDEDDMQEWLSEGCEFLAERFKSEHWKLTDRQGRMLAKPYTACANKLWIKMLDWLPDFLSNLAKASPEAAAMVISTAVVFGPKVAKQFVLSRSRKELPKKSAEDKPQQVKEVPKPKPAAPAKGEIEDDEANLGFATAEATS